MTLTIGQLDPSIDDPSPGEQFDVTVSVVHNDFDGDILDFTLSFYVDGEFRNQISDTLYPPNRGPGAQNYTFSITFDDPGTHSFSAELPDYDDSETRTIRVSTVGAAAADTEPTFADTRPAVEFRNITAPENVDEPPETLQLKYDQPDISVDTSSRFQEHQAIGGPTIRQKTGVDPVEISIDGVCTTIEANAIDGLRHEQTITLVSNRIEQVCQVGSTSTSPLDSGGAIDMDGEFTHNFSISLVGVE